MKLLLTFAISFALCGCSPLVSRGEFRAVSTKPIQHNFVAVSKERSVGRACFNQLKAQLFLPDAVYEAAVADAINKVSGATLLLDAVMVDEGSCVEVTGIPAR